MPKVMFSRKISSVSRPILSEGRSQKRPMPCPKRGNISASWFSSVPAFCIRSDAYLDDLVDAYAGFDGLDDAVDDAVAVFDEITLVGGRGPTCDGRAPGIHPVALVDGAVDPAAHHVSGLSAVQAEAGDGGAGEVVDGVAVGNGDHVEAAAGLGDHVGGVCGGLGLGPYPGPGPP